MMLKLGLGVGSRTRIGARPLPESPSFACAGVALVVGARPRAKLWTGAAA